MNARAQRVVFFVSLVLLLGGCGVYVPQTVSLWADVHPQGWVVFTGSRAPFPPPPPQKPIDLANKILLFHPALGVTLTTVEEPSVELSWPRFGPNDALYFIGNSQKIYKLSISFDDMERSIYDPQLLLQAKPRSLQEAQLLWTDEGGISALALSPDGRYIAFLRESESYSNKQFAVVIVDMAQDPPKEVAALSTVYLTRVIWTADSKAVLLAHQEPERSVKIGDQEFSLGMITRYEIDTAKETVLARGVLFSTGPQDQDGSSYPESVYGPGPLALSPDGQTLYYTDLVTLSPRTAQDMRLGLYSVELASGARQLLFELPQEEIGHELAVSPSGRRLAFTAVSYRVGMGGFALHSALYLADGDHVRQLAQQTNGWLFPLWLDDVQLAYVQFRIEITEGEQPALPAGVQPALWVHNVATGERSNHLPALTTQIQIDALRQRIRQLEERVQNLEKALHELQNKK
ncbi:MAG: hypothetical protein ACK4HB_03515 [Candidatus Bipolaricaulia bacterium]